MFKVSLTWNIFDTCKLQINRFSEYLFPTVEVDIPVIIQLYKESIFIFVQAIFPNNLKLIMQYTLIIKLTKFKTLTVVVKMFVCFKNKQKSEPTACTNESVDFIKSTNSL